jgi:hypothetical protein
VRGDLATEENAAPPDLDLTADEPAEPEPDQFIPSRLKE